MARSRTTVPLPCPATRGSRRSPRPTTMKSVAARAATSQCDLTTQTLSTPVATWDILRATTTAPASCAILQSGQSHFRAGRPGRPGTASSGRSRSCSHLTIRTCCTRPATMSSAPPTRGTVGRRSVLISPATIRARWRTPVARSPGTIAGPSTTEPSLPSSSHQWSVDFSGPARMMAWCISHVTAARAGKM